MPPSFLMLTLCALLAPTCNQTVSESGSDSVDIEVAFPNLSFARPVDLQHAGDGSGRLFVVEQAGVIRVFENRTDVPTAGIFLDIKSRVDDGSNEMGLLGLAFHPDYAANGFFFVDYTAANPRRTVVARYRVDPGNPAQADPNSELVLLEIEQPFGNHNGGQVAFGPDGYLYIAMGDGGSGGDPQGNGQNRNALLGKILRIDVDNPGAGRNYGIPSDNPFVAALCGPVGCRDEIYAFGLRNPWRFSFDAQGRLWVGDVGQNAWEEIDIVEKGGNYGWNLMEANHCFEPQTGCERDDLLRPVWEYDRDAGRSITGGYVYRGANVPALAGKYVYGDFVSGKIWALAYDGTDAVNEELLDTSLGIASFGEDASGELYLCAFDGKIYRFVPSLSSGVEEVPKGAHRLGASYPNPFDLLTSVPFQLAYAARVEVAVYDALGRLVRTLVQGLQEAGEHRATWDGRDEAGMALAGGTYFVRLRVDDTFVATRQTALAW